MMDDEYPTPDVRQMPMTALFMLGRHASEPGFVSFLIEARDQGFGLAQPGDADLSNERWIEVAEARVKALCMAWVTAKENQ